MFKPRDLSYTTLAEVVSAEAGVSLKTVDTVLRTFFDVVGRTVVSGFKVNVTNFGTWYRSEVAPRVRRDLATGEEWRQARTNYPRFRYAPKFRDATTSGQVPTTLKKRGRYPVK